MTKAERINLVAASLDPKTYEYLLKGQPDMKTDPGSWLHWCLMCEMWQKALYQAEKAISIADETR